MRVLLTKPWATKKQVAISTLPLGIMYIGSYLKKTQPDIEVILWDPEINNFDSEDDFCQSIVGLNPDVVGITMFSYAVPLTKRLVSRLKKKLPRTIFVGGGFHINSVPDKAFSHLPDFDYFIHGEGEKSFSELCSRIKNSNKSIEDIKGLIYRNNGNVQINEKLYSSDIGIFDPLDYSLINPKKYFEGSPMGLFHKGKNVLQILTTRGCPYSCTYCGGPLGMGRKIRTRATENIVNEILELRSFGADEIHIMDDNFTFNKDHVISLCKRIIELNLKMHFVLPNGIRLDKVDEEMLSYMKKAGFYQVGFGIEVGSDESLKKIKKNPKYSFADMKEKINMVKKFGITTIGFFIVGFPFDTEKDIEDTRKAASILGLDLASYGNFVPLPGTELFNDAVKAGEIPEDYIPSVASGVVEYSPKGISRERLTQLHRKIILLYYLNPKRIIFILKTLHFKDLKFVFRRLYHIIFRPKVVK
jgi:radical SAM superfamily enzyme YgiQ (UPF0313 family)